MLSHHLPQDSQALPGPVPPCQAACPVHQEVRDYLFSIATGDFDEAMNIIRKTNPLPAICGTICAHHCEDECRRQDVDKSLSIRGLKRFAVEKGNPDPVEVPSPDPSKKVAVVGGGPSGLTAAWDLALQGCEVTVFDREKYIGGAVRHYIPSYRLPDEVMDKDVQEMEKIGIKFKTETEVGQDVSLAKLKEQGYQAIILAAGLPKSRTLPLPGADSTKVMEALPFLQGVKREGFRFEGNPTVVVIGGGNVAMDVARSAVRSGAGKVKLTCLESDEEMPAFPWEIEEAREEGVEMHPAWGPKEIKTEGDKIAGLEIKECTAVFDEQGNFSPCFNEGNTSVLEGDIVIFSIGQAADLSPLSGELELNERGNVIYDRQTMATSMDGVFTCGEVAQGPGTAVQAMASGRRSAMAVKAYLEGKTFVVDSALEEEPAEKLDSEVAEKVLTRERQELKLEPAEKRKGDFEHIEHCFTLEQGLQEAQRCLGCLAGAERLDELCANCLTCLRVCPYGVPVINEEGTLSIRSEQCQACGLCIGVCPALAIEFRTDMIEKAEENLEKTAERLASEGDKNPSLLVINCAFGQYATPEFKEKYASGSGNVQAVSFPCVSKVDTMHLLKAFEAGVDGVLVAGCKEEEECTYRDSYFWAEKRVEHTRKVLEDVGIEPERLLFKQLSTEEVKNFSQVVEEAENQLKETGPSPVGA